MNNNNDKTNELIELIYESALQPSKWVDLLNALAEFVDFIESQPGAINAEQSLLSVIPGLSNNEEKTSQTSISETLKSITDINEKQNLPEISQANDFLIGHFTRALKIAKRLVDIDEQHNIVLSLLDRMPIALVLLDSNAQIIETNALAGELFISDSGINIKENVLDVGYKSNSRFLELVHKMSKHDSAITHGQSLSVINSSSENNISLFIAPLQQMDLNQSASVAVFISQQKTQPFLLPQEFTEQYGLTKKEVEITQLLVKGLSINEISGEQHVSAHTVRSQVKSVMNKTATSRQIELVSLVYKGMGDFVTSLRNIESGSSSVLNASKVLTKNYKTFQLEDGRNLAYSEYGDLNGEPVFHCHSIFGSRLELAINSEKITLSKAVRLIVMDRPGYGASDSCPNMSFTHWVKDLTQLADHLKINKFSLTGYAMGGQYALACAHEIPARLKRVTIISTGMTPESTSDYKGGIPLYKMSTRLAKHIPKLYQLIMAIAVKGVLSDPNSFFNQFQGYLDSEDQSVMNSEEFKKNMYATFKEGIRLGGKSGPNETVMLMSDWGFKLENITIPIDIWHGTHDRNVPLILGKRFTEHVKNTNLYVKEGQGHYMFYTHWAEILEQLLNKS